MNEPTDESIAESTGVPSRRDLLKGGATAAGAAALGAAGPEDTLLPEAEWSDRMRAPDDGKRYGWIVDTRRCFGCHACEVACKAENDVPLGHFIRQTVYHDYERPAESAPEGQKAGVARVMVPLACQHCEDAPCIKACPCGAMHKGPGGSVQVNYDLCSGHSACKDACPYGAIYIDPVANQAVKCHNCTHRLDAGMEPACVSTCPSDALLFGDLNDPESDVSRTAAELERDNLLEELRPEKNTRTRMRFVVDAAHPLAAWEPKVPTEGQSYSTDAYSVFEWGEPGFDEVRDSEDAR